ncbi:HNH endonuclease [Lacticaseibacillus paracasei]|uniref:HNH endonuclease n=1 Tax=Lacticaseibacillus paracasei TaxID=1597 RepID=UPI0029586D31|nr:HNH endonuclease signature motif containing protein [Lacticaseibacillus paracasei]
MMSYRSKRRSGEVHICGQPLCHRVIPIGQRYCPVHQAQHEQEWREKKDKYRRSKLAQQLKANKSKEYDKLQRDQVARAFYHSSRWTKVRDATYARDGATCQVCGNVVQDRKIVDHIVPRRLLKPQEALDSSNLWTLCYKCHFRKTKLEKIISRKSNGDNKLKHLDRQWWTKVLREKKEEKNK